MLGLTLLLGGMATGAALVVKLRPPWLGDIVGVLPLPSGPYQGVWRCMVPFKRPAKLTRMCDSCDASATRSGQTTGTVEMDRVDTPGGLEFWICKHTVFGPANQVWSQPKGVNPLHVGPRAQEWRIPMLPPVRPPDDPLAQGMREISRRVAPAR